MRPTLSSAVDSVPRLREAQDHLDYWREHLGMTHWRVRVEVGRDMSSNTAHTHVTWNYDDALIEVQPWVLGISPAPSPDDSVFASVVDDPLEFERLMVHELLHAFMRRHARAHSKLAEQLPQPLQEAYGVLRGDADEEIVDILAGVLVRLRHNAPSVVVAFDGSRSPDSTVLVPTP